jgi:hypothetical protein
MKTGRYQRKKFRSSSRNEIANLAELAIVQVQARDRKAVDRMVRVLREEARTDRAARTVHHQHEVQADRHT